MLRLLLFYTDPGSGVMLLQVLLAFLAGGLFYFRNLVKSIFRFGTTAAPSTDQETDRIPDTSSKD